MCFEENIYFTGNIYSITFAKGILYVNIENRITFERQDIHEKFINVPGSNWAQENER